jgi:hypothetical protein
MQSSVTKICTKCKVSKTLSNFHDNPLGRLGKQSRCKRCQSEGTKKWRTTHSDDNRASSRRSVLKNKAYWRSNDPRQAKPYKICPNCSKSKGSLEFDICSGAADGLQSWCRGCSSAKYHKQTSRQLLVQARTRAKKLGIEFTLTISEIEIPEKCPVLGIDLYTNKGKAGYNSPSLDRIDSTKGYVPGNVKVISYRANWLKGNANIEEVRSILKYMEINKC